MKGKQWLILIASLAVILLASSIGVTEASFFDQEISIGNTFQAWTSRKWVQTSQADFDAGILDNVDTSSSLGDVKLGSVAEEPTTSVGSEEGWYADWSYRKKITIDHTQVDANLTDFPVLISLASDSGLASHAQSDGDDILFTSSNGTTKLDHGIETFDGSTGKLIAWVRIPSLSSSVNTEIYMYYGNATCANQQNPTAVWDSNYKGVWHLSEDPSGTAPQIKDSTSNVHHGTSGGSMTAGDQVAGRVDGSLDLDGTDDYIQTTSGESKTASDITWEVWFKADVTTASHHILWQGPVSQNGWGEPGQAASHEMHLTIGRMSTADRLVFFYGYEYASGNFVPAVEIDIAFSDTSSWNYAVGVLTGAGTSPSGTLYLNGSSVGTDTGTETGRTSWDTNLRIGQCGAAQRRFDGLVDEVRISNIARSAAWIKTCYNNQNSPSSFHSVGSEESWYYTSWSRRAPVTISNPGSDLTDYQVKVDVTYGADMQPDFDDIRFVDSDDSTELSHWRESYTASTSAIFWVKVPSVPSGNKTIYMYYGNAAASSASDGNATFLLYDDFEEHAIGEIPDGWTMYPGCSGVVVQDDAGNKVLDDGTGSGGNVIAGDPSWTDIACRQRFRSVDDVVSHAGVVIRYTDEGNEVYGGIVSDTTAEIWNRIGGTWTQISNTWTIPDVGTTWHVQELRIAGDIVELYIDDEYIGSGTVSSGAPTSGASGFWCQYSHEGYRDEHIVRKYAPHRTYVSSGTIASLVLDTEVDGASWYDSDWSYRKKITIEHTKVDANLTDFPVLISLSSDSDLAAHAQGDGDDILFASSNGTTKLSHEIEGFGNSTGKLIAWVKAPSLSGSTDTDIYMYYGNSTCGNQEDVPGVWDSNFKAVWHLNETTGGAEAILDSTSNNNDGTDNGNPTLGVTGQIGNAIDFNGTTDYIQVPSSSSLKLAGGPTIEAWINVDSWGDWKNIVFKGDNSASNTDYQFALVNNGLAWDGTLAGTWRTKYFNTPQDTGTWIYVVVTHNTSTVKCYRGGSEISSQSDAGAIYESDVVLGIAAVAYSGTSLLDGKVDEVRISDKARSAAWIKTCYNNQNSPSSFYSLGPADVGTRWDALFWDETLQSNTDITFEVRASNNLFAKDAEPDPPSVPDWISVGGTSPVTSGLPSGRYMQWRATLTTSDTSKTPTLHEVRVYYSDC